MNQSRDAIREPADSLARRKAPEEEPQFRADAPPYTLLRLQRAAGNRAVVRLLESSAQLRTKSKGAEPGGEYEQDADLAAARALNLSPAPVGVVQHKCAACSTGTTCSSCSDEEIIQRKERGAHLLTGIGTRLQRAPAGTDSKTTSAAVAPAVESAEAARPVSTSPLIMEDEAAELTPGQMRKGDFLAELRGAACAAADEAMASAGRDTRGCPYIEKAFDSYARRPASYVERAMRKYAPEAAGATSARDYIPAVSARISRGVGEWIETGQVTGVPEELAGMMPGGGLLGGIGALGAMIGGAVSGIVSGIGAAVSGAIGAVGGALSGVGRAFFKKKEGGREAKDDPQQIRGELSGGQPLDGGIRSQMGTAFGHDFSGVRVHTDGSATSLSENLNARAFTIGSDIAFGAGEYRPGTLVGDALIAHELAHVVQQRGGVSTAERTPTGESPSLETEADDAAVDAVLSLRPADRSSRSALKTSLRLQRCDNAPYSDTNLQGFITKLGSKGVQRGFYDDDRARGVVRRWQDRAEGFELTARIKYLLIKTMLDGVTGGDDERAILDLLVFSENDHLRTIFETMGLRPDELDKKFSGDNLKELLGFYSQRFEGGRAALAARRVIPQGEPRRSTPMTHDEMLVERAKQYIPILEQYLAEWNTYAMRVQARKNMLESREKIEDPLAALEGRPEIEAARIAQMNRKPLKIDAAGDNVIFRVKFQAKFLDKAKRGDFPTLKSAVESAAAERWSKDVDKVIEGKKRFELITDVTEIKHDATRDPNYWLIEVRTSDTGPVEHPGCKLDQPGVPAGVTDSTCDGGVMSLPPKSIGDSDLIAHEMLHLFGLVDRYMMYTYMKPGNKEVDRVETNPTRETQKRPDMLGGQKASILDEDLAFLFEHLGVYESELYRGLKVLPVLQQKLGMGLQEVERELERQKEIVRHGRDPNSLIPSIIRRDFVPELGKNAEDL